jgi:hypothetical protein
MPIKKVSEVSRDIVSSLSESSQPFAVGDGTAIRREVRLFLQVQRKIFPKLHFNDFDVSAKT